MTLRRAEEHVDVIVIGSMWWAGHQLTDQRITKELRGLGQRIVYVNPSYSAFIRAEHTVQGNPGRLGLSVTADGHEVLSPMGLPLRSRPLLASVNAFFTAAQILFALRGRMSRRTTVLAFAAHPTLFAALRVWRRVAVVKDDYAAGGELIGQRAAVVHRRRRIALTRASAVVTVSQTLGTALLKQGFSTTVIPPGVTIVPTSQAHASQLDGIPHPRAVFSGLISDRIDLDLLEAVADAGWHLVFVGGVQPTFTAGDAFERLSARSNVTRLGWCSPEDLYAIAAACDVGLLVYALSEFNMASSPLKTLEYLAAGLPVLATAIPSVLELECPDIHVVLERADVELILGQILDAGDSAALRARRTGFAAQNSWTARAHAYLGVLHS